jgi:hypothetical protein
MYLLSSWASCVGNAHSICICRENIRNFSLILLSQLSHLRTSKQCIGWFLRIGMCRGRKISQHSGKHFHYHDKDEWTMGLSHSRWEVWFEGLVGENDCGAYLLLFLTKGDEKIFCETGRTWQTVRKRIQILSSCHDPWFIEIFITMRMLFCQHCIHCVQLGIHLPPPSHCKIHISPLSQITPKFNHPEGGNCSVWWNVVKTSLL